MVTCESCGNESLERDIYCRLCGAELPDSEVLECECGAEVLPEDNYCHKCGSAFVKDDDKSDEEEGDDADDSDSEEEKGL